MITAKIARHETVKRGEVATLFHPFTDPISLRMTIVVSGDGASVPHPIVMVSSFQIISFDDNQIKYQQQSQMEITPDGSAEYYMWIDLGSAYQLNLDWLNSGLFGFRGAVELFGPPGRVVGGVTIDAHDVSEIRWFRFELAAKI